MTNKQTFLKPLLKEVKNKATVLSILFAVLGVFIVLGMTSSVLFHYEP